MSNRRTFLGTAALTAGAAAAAASAVASTPRGTSRIATGRVRTKDSTELFVRDWGSGRPVVLIHAWPMSSDCWEQQAIALVDAGFRVITYDRRGFGRSSQPASGYNYDTFSDDLAAVIEATGARDVTLAGYSMGGGEVVRYLSRHGSKNIVKVGLVASVVPGLGKNRNNPDGIDPALFDGLKDGLRKDRATFLSGLLKDVFFDVQTSARSSNPVSQPTLDWAWQMGMQAGLLALIDSVDAFGHEDFTPDLAAVSVPTLILHGNADKPVPIDLSARRAAVAIRQAKLIEYPGASHALVITERQKVNDDLIAFLKA
jgi:non-heme chloroperoxidase